ncbi:LRR receptor-like serine threonine-protein kinase [Seminavis robusta]|uniref:LRR receptor-like serine threonine-protein kinase n=1 Tax=Seminavis robusta TaxID=568900 RepID=A0A9N8H3S0_9STRA|nr:LRR receptor-like serine threonine-protein kinase [Seminavis robusta]|eukprot:Sro45_g026850.1 LRR receptor-like serine threonine-protein kinase (716) ;mRNA; f:25436-27765
MNHLGHEKGEDVEEGFNILDVVAARCRGESDAKLLGVESSEDVVEEWQKQDKEQPLAQEGQTKPHKNERTDGLEENAAAAKEVIEQRQNRIESTEGKEENDMAVKEAIEQQENFLLGISGPQQPPLASTNDPEDQQPGAYSVSRCSDGSSPYGSHNIEARGGPAILSGNSGDFCEEEIEAEETPATLCGNSGDADHGISSVAEVGFGLAVANQVEEHEEPTQVAIPDELSKDKRSPSPSLLILTLLGGILIVGIAVGSICGAGLCSNKDGDVETQAPTSFRYFVLEDVRNRIEEDFGADYFQRNNGTSREELEWIHPRNKALEWIVFEDPLQLDPDASNLLQRFILALTYFQTAQESDWLICGQSTTAEDVLCWKEIQGESRWLTGFHECQWAFVFCDGEKNITQLELEENGLNGLLPTELARLSALERLDFHGNQLTGTVPSVYGSFPYLSKLYLDHNDLSGTIPSELFGSPLSQILLTNNTLTGTVPTEIGLFEGSRLLLGSNSLSGSIPVEIFRPGTGVFLSLDFADNKLTGTLPTEIAALHGLHQVFLHLQGNPLSGTIPSEIGLLEGSLRELDISRTNMDGTLPEELFASCTNLVALLASNSGLTGTISSGLQLLTQLASFDISNNKFHGTIPEQLSSLKGLQHFLVDRNDLSGSIPSSICFLADPLKEEFEVAADCLPWKGTGNPMVECSCCTLCCDGGDVDYCLSQHT